jgi:hypothetical protein
MCGVSLCTRGAPDSAARRRSTAALGDNVDNEDLVRNWHRAIIEECRSILGRELTSAESKFVESRGAFIGLEWMEDHIRTLRDNPTALEQFLRSEAK